MVNIVGQVLAQKIIQMATERKEVDPWELSLEIYKNPEFADIGIGRQAIYDRIKRARINNGNKPIRAFSNGCPLCNEGISREKRTEHYQIVHGISTVMKKRAKRSQRYCKVCGRIIEGNLSLSEHKNCHEQTLPSYKPQNEENKGLPVISKEIYDPDKHLLLQWLNEITHLMGERSKREKLEKELSSLKLDFNEYKVKIAEVLSSLR